MAITKERSHYHSVYNIRVYRYALTNIHHFLMFSNFRNRKLPQNENPNNVEILIEAMIMDGENQLRWYRRYLGQSLSKI